MFESDDLASFAAPQGVCRRRKDHMPTGDMTGRLHQRAAQIQEAASGFQIDQEIDITCFVRLASRDRAQRHGCFARHG